MDPRPTFSGKHSWEIFEVIPRERLLGRQPWLSNPGSPNPRPPRAASTVVPLRQTADGLRVWMMRRREELVFGGMWVFPGGKVDPVDDHEPDPWLACALREYAEETALEISAEDLIHWSRWITSVEAPVRFDTQFYLTVVPDGSEPTPDAGEAQVGDWFDPYAVVSADPRDPDTPRMITPTRTVLWELALLGSWDAIATAAGTREIEPILARIRPDGEAYNLSHPRRDGSWT